MGLQKATAVHEVLSLHIIQSAIFRYSAYFLKIFGIPILGTFLLVGTVSPYPTSHLTIAVWHVAFCLVRSCKKPAYKPIYHVQCPSFSNRSTIASRSSNRVRCSLQVWSAMFGQPQPLCCARHNLHQANCASIGYHVRTEGRFGIHLR